MNQIKKNNEINSTFGFVLEANASVLTHGFHGRFMEGGPRGFMRSDERW